MSRRLFRLTDHAWSATEPSSPTNQSGAQRVDDRRMISGIVQDWSTPDGQQLIGLLFSDVFPALGASIA